MHGEEHPPRALACACPSQTPASNRPPTHLLGFQSPPSLHGASPSHRLAPLSDFLVSHWSGHDPSRTRTRTRTILRPSPWISLGSPLPLFLPRNGSGSDLHEAGVTRHGDTKHAHFRICSRASARASFACASLAGQERAHVVEKAKLRARWRPARGVRRGVAQIRVDTTRGR